MWELDYIESWMQKNLCFWTVVLEKTLVSLLDCKEIKPVNPKGNQSWISIGRTDSSEILPASVIFDFAKFCLFEASPWVCSRSGQVSHPTHSNSSQFRFNIVPGLKEDLLIIIKVCVLCLVTQSCPTLCDPMDCSMPSLPVHHQLPKLSKTHAHQVGDAIQPSHPLSSPSSAFNLSQHQGLFKWISSSHRVAKVLEFQLQHHSFQWIFRVDFLQDWLVWSPWYPRDSPESSPAPQFESINILVLSLLYGPILISIHDYWKNYSFDKTDLCQQRNVSAF